jgi:hypothetical protein
MKIYGIAGQIFVFLALLGLVGWMATRFVGPILKISYEGFHAFTTTCLLFAIAFSLVRLTLSDKSS